MVELLVLPAAILQSPLTRVEHPAALNFGEIGSAIGHELIHVFDESGRNFDEDGTLKSWMSSTSSNRYSTIVSCLADEYEQLMMDGLRKKTMIESQVADEQASMYRFKRFASGQSNDTNTLRHLLLKVSNRRLQRENVADSSGLKLAYQAFRANRLVEPNGSSTLPRPMNRFTADQLFFISFAQVRNQSRLPVT